MMETLEWHGCYDDGWKGVIVDEAFAHPAKFARGLIERIVDFGLAEGWWKRGDLIGDPFAGVGLGAIASVIHPYPTQAEAIKQVADAYRRTALTPGRKKLLSWLMRRRR